MQSSSSSSCPFPSEGKRALNPVATIKALHFGGAQNLSSDVMREPRACDLLSKRSKSEAHYEHQD